MEPNSKKNKVLGIISIIATSIAFLIFIASLIYVVFFFINFDAYKNPNDGGGAEEGIGLAIYFILYIFHAIINAPFSILGIIFGKLAKKWNKKVGNICLIISVCCLILSVLFFGIMMILI